MLSQVKGEQRKRKKVRRKTKKRGVRGNVRVEGTEGRRVDGGRDGNGKTENGDWRG